MDKPQHNGSSPALSIASVCRDDTNPVQSRGAKSFVDDLGLSRGVVSSRAAFSLRSIETKPFDWEICSLKKNTSPGRADASSRGVRPLFLSAFVSGHFCQKNGKVLVSGHFVEKFQR